MAVIVSSWLPGNIRLCVNMWVVPGRKSIFTALRPFRGNSKIAAHVSRGAFDRDAAAEIGGDIATFLHIALTLAGAGRSAFHDGVDERAADAAHNAWLAPPSAEPDGTGFFANRLSTVRCAHNAARD